MIIFTHFNNPLKSLIVNKVDQIGYKIIEMIDLQYFCVENIIMSITGCEKVSDIVVF